MPIEHALSKKEIPAKEQLTIAEKRANCRKFALEQIESQKRQFARLGLETDMSTIYRTLDTDFEVEQLKIFATALEKGLVFQDLKPVY
jgi:isoleucyl-tRNA synthetase